MKRSILAESDAGITEFMLPEIAGFPGVLKHRAVDFHVHEVDLAGEVTRLEQLWTKARARNDLREAQSARKDLSSRFGEAFEFESDERAPLASCFSKENVSKLETFFKDVKASSVDLEVLDVTGDSKAARSAGHKSLKQLPFAELLSSESLSEVGPLAIRVWRREKEMQEKSRPTGSRRDRGKGGKGGKGCKSGKGGKDRPEGPTYRIDQWPSDRPDFLLFKLYKENRDTGEAIANICKCIGKTAKVFAFAGTKDRKARTTQLCTAYRVTEETLTRAVVNPGWDKQVRVEPVKYVSDRLRLGDLSGNRFDVLLRNVEVDEEAQRRVIEEALTSWKTNGFLNYFGMQRFGSRDIGTHEIGAALVRHDYETCVALILGDDSVRANRPAKKQKLDDSVAATNKAAQQEQLLAAFHAKDYKQCLYHTAHFMFIEKSILENLVKNKNDFQGALKQLQHQSLSLYAHAVQSYIFNKVLSHRIATFGRQPRIGDLVLPRESFTGASEIVTEKMTVISDDASAYALSDVVLPLPGADMQYPEYLKDAYANAAQELGVSLNDFATCTIVDLKGAYRRICVIPKDVEWEIISSSDIHTKYTHIESDIERLQAAEDAKKTAFAATKADDDATATMDGTKLALRDVKAPGAESDAIDVSGDAKTALNTNDTDVDVDVADASNGDVKKEDKAIENTAQESDCADVKKQGNAIEDAAQEGECADVKKEENATENAVDEGERKEKNREADFPGRGGVIVRCTLPASAYLTMALREVTKRTPEEL